MSRRVAGTALRGLPARPAASVSSSSFRYVSSSAARLANAADSSSAAGAGKKPGMGRNDAPTPMTSAPIFPAPANPFKPESGGPKLEYSERTKGLVKGMAKLMGYNSRATTAIRATSRMVKGIVESVQRDNAFWYDECGLPPTYQTFFQLHLLYLLTILPRLRSLPAVLESHAESSDVVIAPLSPSEPQRPLASGNQSPSAIPDSASDASASSSSTTPMLGKPLYESYPTEIVNHFFDLAESEMRRVLGANERERVVKQYMEEMGQQWKGAGAGLDYVLGLTCSSDPAESSQADAELASWVWRNLFGSAGLTIGPPARGLEPGEADVDIPARLEEVVRFVRREMARFDKIQDEDILDGNIGQWGPVRS